MPAHQLVEGVPGIYYSPQSIHVINQLKHHYNVIGAVEYRSAIAIILENGEEKQYNDWSLTIHIANPDNPDHELVRVYTRRILDGQEMDPNAASYVFREMYDPEIDQVQQGGSRSKTNLSKSRPKRRAALEKARAIKKLYQNGGWR